MVECLYIRYKRNGCVLTALFYGVCESIRGALSLCLAQKKNDFVLLVQCSNSANGGS